MIRFKFDPEKFASAAAYFVHKIPNLTKKQICKLMYFADKEHLLRYGRTITGDHYCALPQGHVPSNGLNAMNGKAEKVGTLAVERVRHYGHLQGWHFVLDREPDMKVFSRTDVRVMDEILQKMGHLTAWQLERKSHNEPSWKQTEPNKRIRFELFFSGRPDADAMKEILIEEHDTPKKLGVLCAGS